MSLAKLSNDQLHVYAAYCAAAEAVLKTRLQVHVVDEGRRSRALAPDRGETTAQTRLLPQQKTLIRTALSRGRTECGLPLLAQLPQLTPEQRKIATQLLAQPL